jgi:hypothetical protein
MRKWIGILTVLLVAVVGGLVGASSAQRYNYVDHATEFDIRVAHGDFSDVVGFHKFGQNVSVDSAAEEDIWNVGGEYTFPANAEILDFVSSSDQDNGLLLLTGAHTLRVFGLDASYVEIQEDITLEGEGVVSTTKEYLRAYRAFVLTAGAIGTNVGTITADNTVSSNVLIHINPLDGQTLLAMYTVPAGKSFLIVRLYASIGKKQATSATIHFLIRPFGMAWRRLQNVGLNSVGSTTAALVHRIPLLMSEKTDIKLRAEVSANGSDINAGFEGYLVTDE